jgi:hypothetical protein
MALKTKNEKGVEGETLFLLGLAWENLKLGEAPAFRLEHTIHPCSTPIGHPICKWQSTAYQKTLFG